ncbi:MAG: hypothetical protein R3293_24300 [Candidatus Promineifilaceae bacterium]|nr:hypothetical protein [Candidatus Promineifilaceae bacterium]
MTSLEDLSNFSAPQDAIFWKRWHLTPPNPYRYRLRNRNSNMQLQKPGFSKKPGFQPRAGGDKESEWLYNLLQQNIVPYLNQQCPKHTAHIRSTESVLS